MQKRIIILGGGTAGWMAAARIAAEKIRIHDESINITLIESDVIPTIGVGEGTWPSMRSTLNQIGIPEKEFLNFCNASFKQGSRFVNWRDENSVYDHPFSLPDLPLKTAAGRAFTLDNSGLAFDHWACLQSDMVDNFRCPKQKQTPDYAGVFNYGYHLDAGLFAQLLRRYAVEKYGVTHVVGNFSNAIMSADGSIASLCLDDGRQFEADFFIDASGTHNALIGGVLESEFVSLGEVSPNNRALALPVSYAEENSPIESATLSTAQSAGWIWDIGLQHRRGIGYVYSDTFISEDRARQELDNYAKKINPAACSSGARLLKINPGYRRKPWVKNCVAIGMASGFIEPLEASALVMVELAITWLCEHLPVDVDALDNLSARYNELFTTRWGRIRDFLQLHYHLSSRRDTNYWKTVTQDIPLSDRLTGLLKEWRHRDPSLNDFGNYMELFPAASYQYVLLGMQPDFMSRSVSRGEIDFRDTQEHLRANRQKLPHYLANLPSNRDYLTAVKFA